MLALHLPAEKVEEIEINGKKIRTKTFKISSLEELEMLISKFITIDPRPLSYTYITDYGFLADVGIIYPEFKLKEVKDAINNKFSMNKAYNTEKDVDTFMFQSLYNPFYVGLDLLYEYNVIYAYITFYSPHMLLMPLAFLR